MVVDLFLVYSFIRRLVTPFDQWEAYKLGIIDKDGTILIKRKDFVKKAQRDAFGIFDKLILNIKKLLAKLPGGGTRLGTYAAALWLVKEEARMEEAGMLNESSDLDDSELELRLQAFEEEYSILFEKAIEEEPTMSVGSGAIAGLGVGDQGEPGRSVKHQPKLAMTRRKKKQFKDLIKDTK
jgi:hypothetical protein